MHPLITHHPTQFNNFPRGKLSRQERIQYFRLSLRKPSFSIQYEIQTFGFMIFNRSSQNLV